MVQQTLCTSETIAHWALTTTSRGLLVTCVWHVTQHVQNISYHVYDTWHNMSRISPTGPQWLTYVGLCFHIVWCNAKGVGDREILETYLNSASKNTSDTDIFPHGTKSLLTSVINVLYILLWDYWVSHWDEEIIVTHRIAFSSDHVCGCCSVPNLDLSIRIVLISLLILT